MWLSRRQRLATGLMMPKRTTSDRCEWCSGTVASAVRDDLAELGDFTGTEATLAAMARRMAQAIDDDPDPARFRELRQIMRELTGDRTDDDGDLPDMGTPE